MNELEPLPIDVALGWMSFALRCMRGMALHMADTLPQGSDGNAEATALAAYAANVIEFCDATIATQANPLPAAPAEKGLH